jgi:transcription elongation factor GreA
MGREARLGHRAGMPENRAAHPPTQLTGADYDAVVRELEVLRSRHRLELERRLRDARDFGSPADDDDVLAVFEDIAIEQARIGHLESILRSASIVDGRSAFDGRAGLGCRIRVADEGGRTTDYLLVGRRHAGSGPQEVSSASPVGMALLGARAGDVVDVVLPNDRRRSLEILAVDLPTADAA